MENKTKTNRIGETRMMNCGLEATIIEYRGCEDVDILFEDGMIVPHKDYRCFKKGEIHHPNYDTRILKHQKAHINETRVMNNGMKATIIAYRHCDDIDVQFEDGAIVEHKRYGNFQRGQLSGTGVTKVQQCLNRHNRIGETSIASNGQVMTVIDYENCNNVTVQFEDGTVVENKKWDSFIKGSIKNPNYQLLSGVSYNELVCLFYLRQLGFQKAKSRQIPELQGKELDFYHPDINGYKVAIEYDGYIDNKNHGHTLKKDLLKNKLCKDANILLFRIREPHLPKLNSTSKDYYLCSKDIKSDSLENILKLLINDINITCDCNFNLDINFEKDKKVFNKFINTYHNQYEKTRLSETETMNNGMKATIVKYRNAQDIDIQFEDGTIVKHKRYNMFKRKAIQHPNINTLSVNVANKHIGENKIMKNGLKATIIAYRRYDDIDVQFEDGMVVQHKRYSQFQHETIAHPSINTKISNHGEERLNETRTMLCGLNATIVAYRGCNDLDIQFEDGTIVKHRSYGAFKKGLIAYKSYLPIIQTNPLTIEEELAPILDFEEEKQAKQAGMEGDVLGVIENEEEDRAM